MFTAYILGGGKRFTGDTVDEIACKLNRERITIAPAKLKMLKNRIHTCNNVVVLASRRLTNHEKVKLSMKPKYLAYPFQQIPDTEDLRIRFLKECAK